MLSTEIDLVFEGKAIRIFDQAGDPWFVLADVCKALGISNVTETARALDEDEKADFSLSEVSSGQRRKMIIVSEPGALSIILRANGARKAGTFAWRFRRWVTHEVLPSIRQHGQYPAPADIDVATLPPPDAYQPSVETTPNGRLFEECRRVFGTDKVQALEEPLRGILSANQLRALALGGSVEKALTRNGAWASAAMLFDLQYLVFGVRSLTTQERAMRDMIRMLEPDQRAVTFARLSQQVDRLRALPAS